MSRTPKAKCDTETAPCDMLHVLSRIHWIQKAKKDKLDKLEKPYHQVKSADSSQRRAMG